MLIDNFDLIKPILNINKDEFITVNIRNYPNDESNVNKNINRTIYIDSVELFDLLRKSISTISEVNQARAYIDLGSKRMQDFQDELLYRLAKCNRDNNSPGDIFDLGANISSELEPTSWYWTTEVSSEDRDKVIKWFNSKNIEVLGEIPGLNNIQIITRPFGVNPGETEWPINASINTWSHVLLYFPKSIIIRDDK